MSTRSRLNKVYPGPIEELLPELTSRSVDCIFADPDYNVGVKYQGRSFTKQFDEYIDSTINWSQQCHRVLKDDGNFFIVNYPKNNAYLRARYLDRAFAAVYEYVWVYNTNVGHSPRRFTTAHRTVLHCVKSEKNRFYKDAVAVPYENPTDRRIRALIGHGSRGRMPYSWYYHDLVKNVSRSKSFHSCQIPEDLSEMLFRATTKKGDSVLVLFGGAGSELVVCQRLGLNWISAEIVEEYRDLIARRLERGGELPPAQRMLTSIRARQRALAGQKTLNGSETGAAN